MIIHVVCAARTGRSHDFGDKFGHFHLDLEFEEVGYWMEREVTGLLAMGTSSMLGIDTYTKLLGKDMSPTKATYNCQL